jgi:hypothetical protein
MRRGMADNQRQSIAPTYIAAMWGEGITAEEFDALKAWGRDRLRGWLVGRDVDRGPGPRARMGVGDERNEKMTFHRPKAYRYEVSEVVQRRLPRAALNRYPGAIIGVSVVAGRFAYCLKWAWA